MLIKFLLLLSIIAVTTTSVFGQNRKQDSTFKRCFVGSTFFMLGNLSPKNKPDFVQLNLGYRITRKDVVSLELKTWKYA